MSEDLTILADRLGALRACLRILKEEEKQLRAAILAAPRPNGPVSGRTYCLTIRSTASRQLIRSRLPASVREDPRYWRLTPCDTVTTTARRPEAEAPAPAATAAPTGPPARPPPPRRARKAPARPGEEEDFDLFEPF
jgi:hypothetical protein